MTDQESSFRDLKVGDRVERWLENEYWMDMKIIEIQDRVVKCDAINKNSGKRMGFTPSTGWTFDRDLGCEEDPYLGWGKSFGKTGSYLKFKEKSDV
jgi:hypothetical protein